MKLNKDVCTLCAKKYHKGELDDLGLLNPKKTGIGGYEFIGSCSESDYWTNVRTALKRNCCCFSQKEGDPHPNCPYLTEHSLNECPEDFKENIT